MQVVLLHRFFSAHREELHALCISKMKAHSPERSREELEDDFTLLIDQIAQALMQAAGLPESSPMPHRSPTAVKHGGERQRQGFKIEKVALDFGTISDSLGELAGRDHVAFPAGEYRVFNQCLDTSIAAALEQYSSQEHRQQQEATNERVGFLAHELRNALASARMAYDVLRRGEVGVNSRTGRVLDRGLKRLDQLIDMTLVAVRLTANVQPERKDVRVAELLDDLAEAAVPERDVSISVEAEPDLEVEADVRLLTSAVSNLLQNALKFSCDGGHVVLRARREQQTAVLEVEDECGGLPAGRPDELFAPYVQKNPDRRGLGLGLAITREAVEVQGGSIAVQNLPGKGCVFAVRLRAREPSPIGDARGH